MAIKGGTGVGPACKQGEPLTPAQAEQKRSRRGPCPRCQRATAQSFERHETHYAYRCDTCTCIVESGDIKTTHAPRGRVARPL